jgi:hypothetical protein
MDLKQTKLTKSEWDNTEIQVSPQELEVLRLIINGYNDVNIKINKTPSLISYLKIENNPNITKYLFNKYFRQHIEGYINKNEIPDIVLEANVIVRLKSADQIRLERSISIDENSNIYEFILIQLVEKLCASYKTRETNKGWMSYYYTINQLIRNSIDNINTSLIQVVTSILDKFTPYMSLSYIIENASQIIEKNTHLIKYNNLHLYEHQKQAITIAKRTRTYKTGVNETTQVPFPKLVLYIAPTGTGKTLTPLALSCGHKIIFVCAARHVGLALARSAISVNKRIAFAFGCSSADDVRLHYFAAKEYSVNKRTGRIRKVDNSVGDKVEIMICDIRSYIYAMYYMLAFNTANNIITYWDEPTMTLDYPDHPLHKIIKRNWKENMIPTIFLSSSTLPKEHEMNLTIADFKDKFSNAEVFSIISHDCRKTIPMIDNNGYVVMPHYLSDNYAKISEIVAHCENNLTLLRYFDLESSTQLISYVLKNDYVKLGAQFDRNFASINDIDMTSVKIYYLKVLKNIKSPEIWKTVYEYFNTTRVRRIQPNLTIDPKGNSLLSSGGGLTRQSSINPQTQPQTQSQNIGNSGVYITTKDAYTLTDGPTIFLANDVQKIAKFYIQQANIPDTIMSNIMEKIEYNNMINTKIRELEQTLEELENKMTDKLNSGGDKMSSVSNNKGKKNATKIAVQRLNNTDNVSVVNCTEQINQLTSMIKSTSINDIFVPNKLTHLGKWANGLDTRHAFTSNIDEDTIIKIMLLNDIDNGWKILLLLGIGVFTNHSSIAYTEIMKSLADRQMLYLIIADSDYIYGTNYQFCHGYLGKDLDLTQEKIIQALGRIGRNNIQQDYTARFRDNSQITTLFTTFEPTQKPEVVNMNVLFNSNNIHWTGTDYEMIENEDVNQDGTEDIEDNDNIDDESLSDDENYE